MALTRRTDGTQTANKVFAVWWNDYLDLLTGVMTDQPITIAALTPTRMTRVGSTSTNTGLLSLKTTVSAAHEYLLSISIAGEYGVYDVDNADWVLRGTKNSTILNGGGANLTVSGGWATLAGNNMVVMRSFGGATAGKQLWVMTGATDPTAGNGLLEGDVVLKY